MGAHPGQARPGEWLRRQRVAAGLTQEDLAERSGVSVRAIADIERGRTRKPYPSSVRSLVRALGLPEATGTDLVARYRAGDGTGQADTGQADTGHAGAGRAGDADEAADGAGGVTVPRQLPTRVPHFAGRAGELAQLDGVLDAATSDQAVGATGVVISAIGGTAGVGKTALALHWAHRVAHRFPDGQLYANLRGFDAGNGRPADPGDVLRGFLDALGVHPERLPADVDGLAALYRSVLAGRRMLVLLDNAADAAQVRPLLPASPQCLVIVTSRRELAALAAREGARLLQLDVLSEQEANELLVTRLGKDRAAAEPWAVTELASLCARLPLALSIVVARAAAAPKLPLSSLAAELTELGGRLDALDAGDPAGNVRTVLSLSYRHLPETAARMFRLLGLHPGPDISAAAAASLAGVPVAQARVALRDLTRASLLMEVVPGRFAFHDLLRAYAAEQPTSPEGIASTTRRMLDHYLHAAHQAHRVLYPGRELIDLDACASGVTPETFGGKASALAWLEDEYQVLLKVTDLAARTGFDAHAWRLPVVLWTFQMVCGHWHDGTRLHRLALDAARRRGDLSGQARTQRGLGSFAMSLGAFEEAHECLAAAQSTFRELGDDLGLARTDVILSQTFEFQGRFAEALAVMGDALRLSESVPGDSNMALVRASALNGSAWNSVQLGDLSEARAFCVKAIELCQAIGYSPGEAGTWDTLGVVLQRLGSHPEAVGCFLRAVTLDREMGNRYDLAMALAHLGETYASTGDLRGAREAWDESLRILRTLHHPAAGAVKGQLASLAGGRAAAKPEVLGLADAREAEAARDAGAA
ncbi:MAG: family transcriptional regulator [Actinomycetia bacterium]|jgi:transcriptional regulator with XRE-family HTH domain/tetratricopeptide (TPR) repeat protein|nr:family transcriptional regulator [Actinomycetes bacterium]